jgi:hypothetical protein
VELQISLPGLCGAALKAEAISIENSLLSGRLNEPTQSGQHQKYFTVSNITRPSQ